MLRRVGTLPFLVEHLNGQTTLAVEGEIDAANIDAFEAILAVVTKADTETVILDLTDLEFMDVRGINAMVRARAAIESLGRTFELRHPPPSVHRILEVLRPEMAVEPGPPPEQIIEVVGTSPEGWEQAVADAAAHVSRTIGDLGVAEVFELDLHIVDGAVATYRATVRLRAKPQGT